MRNLLSADASLQSCPQVLWFCTRFLESCRDFPCEQLLVYQFGSKWHSMTSKSYFISSSVSPILKSSVYSRILKTYQASALLHFLALALENLNPARAITCSQGIMQAAHLRVDVENCERSLQFSASHKITDLWFAALNSSSDDFESVWSSSSAITETNVKSLPDSSPTNHVPHKIAN